jgi:ferredoxin
MITCVVKVLEGGANCSRRALDEEVVLRENPENYRLSCVTSVYGDVKVKVQGAVGAAQWTR